MHIEIEQEYTFVSILLCFTYTRVVCYDYLALVAYLSFQHRINSALISEDPDISKIRVGIPAEYFCEDMSEEVLEAWSQVADLLEDNGIRVYPGNNSIKLKVNYKLMLTLESWAYR